MKKNTPFVYMLSALLSSLCLSSAAHGSSVGGQMQPNVTPNMMNLDRSYGYGHPAYESKREASTLEPSNMQGTPSSFGGSTQAGTEDGGGGNGHTVNTQVGPSQSQAQKPAQPGSMPNAPWENDPMGYTKCPRPAMDHLGPLRPGDPPGSDYHPPQKPDFSQTMGSAQNCKSGSDAMLRCAHDGTPATVGTRHLNAMLTGAKMADLALAPSNFNQVAKASQEAQAQQASNACAGAAEDSMESDIVVMRMALINVANEGAAVPTTTYAPVRLLSQAIWMVQQMLKHVYIPMAILLVLPGAVLTQVKCVAGSGMIDLEDEDTMSPFTGILRAMIAIFLIPATQLIVSFAIDIGNSMTFEVQKYIVPLEIMEWAKEQTFNPPSTNDKNFLYGAKALGVAANAGKMTDASEKTSGTEDQSSATNMMQMAFNMMNMALGFGMVILLAFQIVMMCYLMLMGPIAAALFAWPTNMGSLFSKVFANWVDAVTNLALWRFWWCVVLLCMCTRLSWLKEIGEYNPNAQWEMLVFTAFMVILTYVPFMPFDYKPGEMVAKVLEKASEAQKGAGGGGGGGGGGGAGGGGGEGGGEAGGGSSPGGGKSDSGTVPSGSGGGGADVPAPPSEKKGGAPDSGDEPENEQPKPRTPHFGPSALVAAPPSETNASYETRGAIIPPPPMAEPATQNV